MDVKGAFLHANLPESDEIYIRLSKTASTKFATGDIVRLIKSRYGLRQAPKLWYMLLCKALQDYCFKCSTTSECLFVCKGLNGQAHILVYVDDIVIVGSEKPFLHAKKVICNLFTVTDLGECSYVLGLKIERTVKGLFLSQKAYTERVIDLAGMAKAKPCKTPLPLLHCLYEVRKSPTADETNFMRDRPYRAVLGCLIYLSTRTRPNIATAVSLLGKFQEEPAPRHWRNLQHVVRYLIGRSGYGLLHKGVRERPDLGAYSDADWARDLSKRCSRTGYALYINRSPVVWSSKLQLATAKSTAEADFSALQLCTWEACWVRNVLKDLGSHQKELTPIFQDNLETISWTESVQSLRNIKHVETKYHAVRSRVESGTVTVNYTASAENCADCFTKALGPHEFLTHRRRLSVVNVIKYSAW